MHLIAIPTAFPPQHESSAAHRPQRGSMPWTTSEALTPTAAAVYHPRRWHRDEAQPEQTTDYIYLFDDHKRFIVQTTAVAGACISLCLVSVAFYWFTRMRKRFRHKYSSLRCCVMRAKTANADGKTG